MSSNRSFNVLSLLALVVVAACLTSEAAQPQDFSGTFTLPYATRWGQAVLPPGDYLLRFNSGVPPYLVTVQGKHGTVMVMSQGRSDGDRSRPSALIIVRHGNRGTVRALHLAEAGRIYEYFVPKAERQVLAQAPELIQRVPVAMVGK